MKYSISALRSLREQLVPLAKEGARIAQEMRERGLTENRKADASLVTDADLAVSKFLLRALPPLLPGATIVTEEHAPESIDWSKEVVLVDPIDGTKDFAACGNLRAVSMTLV